MLHSSPTEELARKKKPVSWQDMSSEEYGRVEHLSNKTYDSFIDRFVSVFQLACFLFTLYLTHNLLLLTLPCFLIPGKCYGDVSLSLLFTLFEPQEAVQRSWG